MNKSPREYLLGIASGVGISLTLLAVGARLRITAPDALLDLGCLVAGVLLVIISSAMW